ncbi:ABC transporter substrate-binding protein [Brooklawnia cerclae]|uniref:ABC transport system substrate-binding protein n=1 Tax=Brooklawnia cerclae TaxID=349934 RepID=A0ABX0SAG5_9ACTN|nr:ABC transporter substrate-binding protein [Brooklawnia cerclae]NIH55393.1 putative ABC transport system substrate-binding protein [Brooklawnia cerclae]
MTNPLRGMTALAIVGALALAGCGSDSSSGSSSSGTVYRIGITQIVSHPSLDAAREGFKQALADAGIEAEYDEQNAQGDQATATSIASKFASQDLDLVLAVATPTAQAAAQAIIDTPILFTAVTDPVAADLVDSNETPGGNITGTTDMNPVAEQIALVKRLNPDAKTVGILYSSGEVNSQVQVELAREAADEQGLTVVEKTITTTSEVLQAAQTLDVDAIYVPTDNNVVAGLDTVIQVAEDKQIPLIAGETDSVAKGALITYGLDYTELGRQTGEMAVKILTEGADPATLAVESQKTPKLVINTTAAERMGVTVPQDLLDEADETVS